MRGVQRVRGAGAARPGFMVAQGGGGRAVGGLSRRNMLLIVVVLLAIAAILGPEYVLGLFGLLATAKDGAVIGPDRIGSSRGTMSSVDLDSLSSSLDPMSSMFPCNKLDRSGEVSFKSAIVGLSSKGGFDMVAFPGGGQVSSRECSKKIDDAARRARGVMAAVPGEIFSVLSKDAAFSQCKDVTFPGSTMNTALSAHLQMAYGALLYTEEANCADMSFVAMGFLDHLNLNQYLVRLFVGTGEDSEHNFLLLTSADFRHAEKFSLSDPRISDSSIIVDKWNHLLTTKGLLSADVEKFKEGSKFFLPSERVSSLAQDGVLEKVQKLYRVPVLEVNFLNKLRMIPEACQGLMRRAASKVVLGQGFVAQTPMAKHFISAAEKTVASAPSPADGD